MLVEFGNLCRKISREYSRNYLFACSLSTFVLLGSFENLNGGRVYMLPKKNVSNNFSNVGPMLSSLVVQWVMTLKKQAINTL